MDNSEIVPQTVTTAEGLLAKLDMIDSAMQQWLNDLDHDLGQIIYHRIGEIVTDAQSVCLSLEDWEEITQKINSITAGFPSKGSRAL